MPSAEDIKNDRRIEEYKFLRQEHENNRKFVFERPLVIVVTVLAAILGTKLQDLTVLRLVPILVLSILYYNLRFTFNRLQSSARIVAYIKHFHEGNGINGIVPAGWETALEKFRNSNLADCTQTRENPKIDSMGFYKDIYWFHIFSGLIFAWILFVYIHPQNDLSGSTRRIFQHGLTATDRMCLEWFVLPMIAYIAASLHYLPGKVSRLIARQMGFWEFVYSPDSNKASLMSVEMASASNSPKSGPVQEKPTVARNHQRAPSRRSR